MNPANYNASHWMKASLGPGLYVICVLALAVSAIAANWNEPSRALAKEIASASGPGTIGLSVTNLSSLSKEDVAEIQRAIEAQLRASGVRVGAAENANSEVRVTLSENLQGLVWVAEVKQGNNTQIAMVAVPRAQGAVASRSGPTVTVRKALLWLQPTQILDAIVLDNASPNARLMVLDPETITSYTIAGDKWQREQSWKITAGHPFPRDLRGLLVPNQNRGVDAYLPGTVCSLSGQSIVCHDGDDPWKIGQRAAFFNSGRNYFTGATAPASEGGVPFYSAAWLERQNYSLGIFAGFDGRVYLTDGVNQRTISAANTADWGSDIAAVKSSCGTGMQLLVTTNGDDTQTDSLRAFEIPDREPIQVSAPQEFPGPITALWSHDATSAIAVARNLRTGQYEAYTVSITCNY
jgi:hypothetical protein